MYVYVSIVFNYVQLYTVSARAHIFVSMLHPFQGVAADRFFSKKLPTAQPMSKTRPP
jgi:hypothetical protein